MCDACAAETKALRREQIKASWAQAQSWELNINSSFHSRGPSEQMGDTATNSTVVVNISSDFQ